MIKRIHPATDLIPFRSLLEGVVVGDKNLLPRHQVPGCNNGHDQTIPAHPKVKIHHVQRGGLDSHGVPELGKVRVGFEGMATLVGQGRPVVGQALLLLPNVQVDLLAAAEQTRVRVNVRVTGCHLIL